MLREWGMTGTIHPLPLVRVTPPERTRTWTVARALGIVLASGLLVGGAVQGAGSDARALRELPASARAGLYARTLQNLESVCRGDPKDRLADFCHDQARLALAFPECGGACVDLARTSLHQPTR
jgi:hypothetical protein